MDGICVLQGVVTGGSEPSTIAQLPAECRPEGRLIFNMNVMDWRVLGWMMFNCVSTFSEIFALELFMIVWAKEHLLGHQR